MRGAPDQILGSGNALFAAVASLPAPPAGRVPEQYGGLRFGHGTVDESAPLLGDGGPYSHAKAQIDLSWRPPYPGAVRLRPGIVYGPHSEWWSLKIGYLLVQGRLGDLGPKGEGHLQSGACG